MRFAGGKPGNQRGELKHPLDDLDALIVHQTRELGYDVEVILRFARDMVKLDLIR